MFAYAGASTFPTIQADMRERDKFIYSAVIAITSECPPRLDISTQLSCAASQSCS